MTDPSRRAHWFQHYLFKSYGGVLSLLLLAAGLWLVLASESLRFYGVGGRILGGLGLANGLRPPAAVQSLQEDLTEQSAVSGADEPPPGP